MIKTGTVLISGGSQGIGESLARRFALAGYRVGITGRNKTKMNALMESLPGQGHFYIEGDMASDPFYDTLEKTLEEKCPDGIDILINNAGINHIGKIEEIKAQSLREVLEINVVAVARFTQTALPFLKKGQQKKIINVSSIVGVMGVPGRSAYSASKYALEGFSSAWANELYRDGILVQVIRPAGVSTRFHHNTQTDGSTPKSSVSVKTPEQIAEEIFRLSRSRRYSVAPGFKNAFYQWLARYVPALLNSGLRARFEKAR